MGYDIFPSIPKVCDELTKSQQQFVDANRERFYKSRITGKAYRKVDHQGCVIEFRRFWRYERISVRWEDYPPASIWMGWFIYGAWGSLEDVTYKITKRAMTFTRRFTCSAAAGRR